MPDVKNKIRDIFDPSRLAHAYLLLSEQPESGRQLVVELAEKLEYGGIKHKGPLIDIAFFDSAGGSSIGIDTIRKVKRFLSQKPLRSTRLIAVIEGGDVMTTEAQNALLKISEDPPADALLIVLGRREDNFLPTVLSRFQKVSVGKHRPPAQVTGEISPDLARARELAQKFLRSDRRARTEIIKEVVSKDNDDERDIVKSFIDALVIELAKDKIKHAALLRELLERERLLGDYSLNKRLQLEYFSSLWYN